MGRARTTAFLTAALLAASLVGPPALLAAEDGLFAVNLGLSLWTVVIFLALVALLWKFAWSPILGAVEGREQRIQQALDEAASRQAEAVRLLEEHRAQLADARREVQEIIAEGKAAGERVRREIEEKARAEAQTMVERARKDIERERDAALDELRRESVDLALAAAARLLGRKLDAETDRELVLGYIGDVSRRQEEGVRA